MMCGNEQAAPWCLMPTGNTTAATESEAATFKLPDVAADVFPTIHPSTHFSHHFSIQQYLV